MCSGPAHTEMLFNPNGPTWSALGRWKGTLKRDHSSPAGSLPAEGRRNTCIANSQCWKQCCWELSDLAHDPNRPKLIQSCSSSVRPSLSSPAWDLCSTVLSVNTAYGTGSIMCHHAAVSLQNSYQCPPRSNTPSSWNGVVRFVSVSPLMVGVWRLPDSSLSFGFQVPLP